MLKSIVKKFVGDSNERYVQSLPAHRGRDQRPGAGDRGALRRCRPARQDRRVQGSAWRTGETLDDLLPEAFAVVREAARRTVGMRHFDVQLIGGIVLHQGEIAEMKTGEGKTLVATLPLYLNALTGRGVHLVTPNDYLSKCGVQWMGPDLPLPGPDRRASSRTSATTRA